MYRWYEEDTSMIPQHTKTQMSFQKKTFPGMSLIILETGCFKGILQSVYVYIYISTIYIYIHMYMSSIISFFIYPNQGSFFIAHIVPWQVTKTSPCPSWGRHDGSACKAARSGQVPSKGNVKGEKMRNLLIMLCFYLPQLDNIVYRKIW